MEKAFNLGASFIVLLIVTTLVLPGRQTPAITKSFFDGASKLSQVGIGKA
jgi:hypothetical protein